MFVIIKFVQNMYPSQKQSKHFVKHIGYCDYQANTGFDQCVSSSEDQIINLK